MTVLLVLAGGLVGAPARYLTDRWVQSRHSSAFPWGTFVVNVMGSLLLGVVAVSAPRWLVTLVGTGFCGALTTFSTYSVEIVRLAEDSRAALAAGYALLSVAVGFAAFSLGWWLVGAF